MLNYGLQSEMNNFNQKYEARISLSTKASTSSLLGTETPKAESDRDLHTQHFKALQYSVMSGFERILIYLGKINYEQVKYAQNNQIYTPADKPYRTLLGICTKISMLQLLKEKIGFMKCPDEELKKDMLSFLNKFNDVSEPNATVIRQISSYLLSGLQFNICRSPDPKLLVLLREKAECCAQVEKRIKEMDKQIKDGFACI